MPKKITMKRQNHWFIASATLASLATLGISQQVLAQEVAADANAESTLHTVQPNNSSETVTTPATTSADPIETTIESNTVNENNPSVPVDTSKPVSTPTAETVTTSTPAPVAEIQEAPKVVHENGVHQFAERTGVKSEAKISAANRDYYNVGETVRYDRKLESDGHRWLSYVNYSGGRSYVAIEKLATPTVERPITPVPTASVAPTAPTTTPATSTSTSTVAPKVIPSSGTYTFTERTGVKSEAKISAANRDYYNVGEIVRYDRKLESDGHQWLSYVNYSGGRSYVAIAKLAAVPTPPAKETPAVTPAVTTTPKLVSPAPTTSTPKEIPSSGTYTFTERTGVKSEAKISAANRDYYNVGEAVRYDRKLESDGHQWLSYVNYSGGRSYVAIAKLAAVPTPPAKETPAVTPAVTTTPKPATPASTTSTPKEIPSSGTYTFTERTGVKSEAKISAANRDYYNVGETVRYDRKLESDGHQWLSYVNYSGGRSYVAIAKLAAVPTPPAKEVAPTISTVTTKPSATVSAPTTTTSVTPAEETKVYTIQAGDSLQRIATRHGITVAQLKEWNNLSSNLIHPNNRLVVSKPAATSSTAAFKVSASPDVSLQNSFANRNDSKLWPAKAPELKNYKQSDVPLLSQNDPRWAYSEYGNDVSRTIWENGCAIVSLAMVDSYFKGEITNPTSVAEWAGLRHYVYGEGTAWTAFADFGKSYGYKVKEHRTDFNSAMKEIQNGSIGIVSVKGGKFANAGHLMVVRGFDDNKVFLNDPNENSRRNNSYKGHTPTDIKRDALNYWTFSR